MAEESKYNRRQLIGTTALAIAAAQFGILFKHGKEVGRIVGVTGKDSIGRLIEKHARLEAPKHNVA